MDDMSGHRRRNRSILDTISYYTKMALCGPMRVLDYAVSIIFQMNLFVYSKLVGRYPKFLVNHNKSEEAIVQLNIAEYKARAKEEINNLNDEINRKEEYINCLQSDLRNEKRNSGDMHERMQTMYVEIRVLKDEKNDALRRLSELISVRLRDNNPNIVDLNDQYRPTKVAEMFSELYDNEWTGAYDVLQEAFTEEQIIAILLNLVMVAYGFCEERVEEPWIVLTNWFLDMNIPGAQQTTKWLKDSRKSNIKSKVPEVERDYGKRISGMYEETKLREYLSQNNMKTYMTKCIELCLLMVTSDPPVAIECPGWTACNLIENTNQQSTHADDEHTDRNIVQRQQEQTATDEERKPENTVNEKPHFDKELFKEYTCRGPYLEYIVWPTLYLHKNGPILNKGVAQGGKVQYREADNMKVDMVE